MTTTSEFTAAASDRVHDLGAVPYFVPETLEVGKAHGLDGFRFYVLGRGGPLGDVAWPVVASAFGWWNGAMIAKMWDTARERCDLSPYETGLLYLDCTADYGRRTVANVPGLQAFCDAADTVLAAADPAGLGLYSGYVGIPLAADLPGRAMQQIQILREYMGSAHLVAVLAVGLSPKVAHGVRRPEGWDMFGYKGEPVPEATPERRELLAAADALTQTMIAPAYGVLDPSQQDAMATALVAIEKACLGDLSLVRP